jgi:hypothetical protein
VDFVSFLQEKFCAVKGMSGELDDEEETHRYEPS